jgi:ribonucleoside-triphosphate reductase
LPRIGYVAQNEEEFFVLLAKRMDMAKESLEIKRKILEKLTAENLYPYIKFYLRHIKERFDQYWKNHFSTVGLLGMNEACLNLLKEDITSAKGKDFAVRVLKFMRDRLLVYQEETGNIFNLEATPAEGTSYSLAKLDKAMYPDIICANENVPGEHEPFYSNSTHLPVQFTDDVFEALDHQDELQCLYTGGTVLHGFIGERINDTQTVKNLVRTICSKYRLPYFTITPTFSVCPSCGYLAGEQPTCERCGSECEVYSRVVGYLRPVKQWNKGKKEEFRERKTYHVCA